LAEVSLNGISKRFAAVAAVSDLSLAIADGEFIVLLGPTGAGKTTTLRLIAGLEKADAGSISIAGRSVDDREPAARDVAFVFQQFALYPHLSVFDNLAFPLRSPARRMAEDRIKVRVQEIAELLGIASKLGNKSTQLSGGEMQRVAIGRALVRRPLIYLMDEPLSSLDAKLRSDLRLELKRIQGELGATILYVTHDQTEAMTMANRIGVISEGRLIQLGAPREVYENPKSIYVAQRLGQPQINLLPAGLLQAGRLPAGTRTVGARTEHLVIERSKKGEAVVDWIEHLGDQNRLHAVLGESRITALITPHARFQPNDRVSLRLVNPLCFNAAGDRITS
jgi:multiple sugar transport system ATP-binding protein